MHAQPRQIADAVRLGARGYMLKGANGAEVIEGIQEVLAGRCYWSSPIAGIVARLSASADASSVSKALSLRECQILSFVIRGRSSASIADTLHLSVKTVETYRSRLMHKLGVDDITGLMRFAFREEMLGEDAE